MNKFPIAKGSWYVSVKHVITGVPIGEALMYALFPVNMVAN